MVDGAEDWSAATGVHSRGSCGSFPAPPVPSTVKALMQKPFRSRQGPCVSVGFGCFWSFSLGSRAVFLTLPAYFRVCVSVAVFLSTETSLYTARLSVVGLCRAFKLKTSVLPWTPDGCQPVPHPDLEIHRASTIVLGGPGQPFPADVWGASGGPKEVAHMGRLSAWPSRYSASHLGVPFSRIQH